MLATHEEKCMHIEVERRDVSIAMRFVLTSGAAVFPIIMVGRSSSKTPQFWTSGTGSLFDGLPIWGQSMLDGLPAYRGSSEPAVLYTSYKTATRDLSAGTIQCIAEPDTLQAPKYRGAIRRCDQPPDAIHDTRTITFVVSYSLYYRA
jgi:hypothetical protein